MYLLHIIFRHLTVVTSLVHCTMYVASMQLADAEDAARRLLSLEADDLADRRGPSAAYTVLYI